MVADVEDLRASPEGRARGVVLEAKLDVGRGPVATILVQRGTLRVGDPLVAGAAWGRVRALIDDKGNPVSEAGPSMPVQVLGLSDVADAGDDFIVAPDDKTARNVAETREHWHRVASIGGSASMMGGGARLEDIFNQIQAGETATLNLVVKAEVTGSLEAVTESLKKLERDDVKLSFARRGVGGITKDDIQLAAASYATIIGFNVRPDRTSRDLAAPGAGRDPYLRDHLQAARGHRSSHGGHVGPRVRRGGDGRSRGARDLPGSPRSAPSPVAWFRSGTHHPGLEGPLPRVTAPSSGRAPITSLKRFKDDAREVAAGFECGIGLSDFQDLKPGDMIETFEEREIPRT